LGGEQIRLGFLVIHLLHSTQVLPCIIHEDEHLLVMDKPAGLNTHAPSPYAGEGLYDWLRHREPRWAALAIIHRLDKETSGVIVFSKTTLANRSLTAQFTRREARKKYLLLTDRPVRQKEFIARSSLVRAGEKYVSRPIHAGSEVAETRFRLLPEAEARKLSSALDTEDGLAAIEPRSAAVPAASCGGVSPPPGTPGETPGELAGEDACATFLTLEAEPLTGRTHQIRVHASDAGLPILGDTLYGGTAAARVYLHAAEIRIRHPATGQPMTFSALPRFGRDPRWQLRAALLEPESTNAYRLVHGASDGWPGWQVERLGDYLLSQGEMPLGAEQRTELERLAGMCSARGVYHKLLSRQVRRVGPAEAAPRLVLGEAAPERFAIRENGVQFELSFDQGYSAGLFLDQRDNRRRLLTGHVAAGFPLFQPENPPAIANQDLEVLNVFAYTCGFSVCAAQAGARVTSLDLSRKYLDWGKRNFVLNGLDPAAHDFIYGDAFDWLRRLGKKNCRFDVILLDPPTFSQSKASGLFCAEKDYGRLVTAALPLLKDGGALFASTNAADWPPEDFVAAVEDAIHAARRKVLLKHYVPQPPDFPVSRPEPAYLKTGWWRVQGEV
jgi:23S rRNA (cytosine1962-C5)-methyltransferase